MKDSHAHAAIKERSRILDIIIYLVMGITLLCCVLPFLYIIAMSFSSSDAIINGEVTFWPVGFNVESYRQIFSYPNFFQAYKNTIIYTLLGTTISLTLMVLFAYPLSKSFLKGQKFVMRLVIFSMYFWRPYSQLSFDFVRTSSNRNNLCDYSTFCHQPI